MTEKDELALWKDRLSRSMAAWAPERERMDAREAIYRGSDKLKAFTAKTGGLYDRAYHVRNIAAENIEGYLPWEGPETCFALRVRGDSMVGARIRDGDIVFRRIDDHTWEGNGHLVYNESVYVLEGEERALVIDAGTWIPNLYQTVTKLTDKPVTLALTHGHGDHVGGAVGFPEAWIHPADTALLGPRRKDYRGEVKYLSEGQVFDLGGRKVEVLYTPGHTSGSVSFFDKDRGYGFSGDAFGSGNLLLFAGTFRGLIGTIDHTLDYMKANGITKLYPGHYHGDNPETIQRLLDEKKMSQELLSGKRQGVVEGSGNGLDHYIHDYGVYIRYSEPAVQ